MQVSTDFLNQGEPLGPYKVAKGIICADCYFEEFGKMIDEEGGMGGHGLHGPRCKGDID